MHLPIVHESAPPGKPLQSPGSLGGSLRDLGLTSVLSCVVARQRGQALMPALTAILPPRDGILLDCLLFHDRLILVVAESTWGYYLRLREMQVMQLVRQHGVNCRIPMTIRTIPSARLSTVTVKPVRAALGKDAATAVITIADGLSHEGLRTALGDLVNTLLNDSIES